MDDISMTELERPALKHLLVAPEPRMILVISRRGRLRHRLAEARRQRQGSSEP
jgi:hypothetical protein